MVYKYRSVLCPTPLPDTTKGNLVFEGDASFLRCEAKGLNDASEGGAGAVSNRAEGEIVFKGKLTMEENKADVSERSWTCSRDGMASSFVHPLPALVSCFASFASLHPDTTEHFTRWGTVVTQTPAFP